MEKDTKYYIGEEKDGTKVYWKPLECLMEYHFPDGSVKTKKPDFT